MSGRVTWKTVQDEELAFLGGEQAVQRVGLALSGGGIRSASFCLGVVQWLARRKWLNEVDYLSTVSGGGYIGAWLSALHARSSGSVPDGQVAPPLSAALEAEIADPQSVSLRWIRRYSNYLTPNTGLSSDTFSTVGLILSNLLLSLLIVGLLLGLLGLLALAFGALLGQWAQRLADSTPPFGWFWGSAAVFFLGSLALWPVVDRLMDRFRHNDTNVQDPSQSWALGLAAGCAILAFFGLAVLMAVYVSRPGLDWFLVWASSDVRFGAVAFGCFHLVGTAPMLALSFAELSKPDPGFWGKQFSGLWCRIAIVLGEAVAAFMAGAAGGATTVLVADELRALDLPLWSALILAGPLTALLSLFAFSVHMMLLGRGLPGELREWWHRVFAWLLVTALAWVGSFGMLTLGPALLAPGTWAWASAAAVAWLGSSAFTALLALGQSVGTSATGKATRLLGVIAPALFLVGLFLFAFTVAARWVAPELGELDCGSLGACWHQVVLVLSDPASGASPATALTFAGIAFLLLALITFFYNANWHSMYHLYRSRLARCFLGATHSKHRETPARFDPKDDIALADIRVRPLHIFNATLNLVGSRELAWQTRKAVSFFFTPFRCGYALSKAGKSGDDIECFAPIGEYMTPEASQDHEGRSGAKRPPRDPWTTHSTVGTALTISGAAVAPSQGYHTNKVLSFIMALFNVRLGRWCPNPDPDRLVPWWFGVLRFIKPLRRWLAKIWSWPDPPFGVWWFVKELLGSTTERSSFVYLTDGGHFDNLGLYELIRRRCRSIVIVDGEHDPHWKFEGLAEAVRKSRIDFGVEIDLDPTRIRPPEGERVSPCSWVAGKVRYLADSGTPDGSILYLKLSLPVPGADGLPGDVVGYAASHRDFPHRTTADQWFDEGQFECYRKLGETIAAQAFASHSGGGLWDAVRIAAQRVGPGSHP